MRLVTVKRRSAIYFVPARLTEPVRLLRSCLLAVVVLLTWAAPARAAPPPDTLPPLLPGEVVTLLGARPELWVADDRTVLHFVGDTRALAGRTVDWSYRLQVSTEQLQRLELGDPWLSSGLVTLESTIYQPRWDTNATTPTLYHIQSAGDLSLFGIDARNYATFVLPEAEWDRRSGFRARDLPRRPLPPLTAPPAAALPASTPTATSPPATTSSSTTPPAGTAPATAAPPPSTPLPAPESASFAFAVTPPPGRDWTDATESRATLTRLLPTGTLQGERVLGLWRRSPGGGPYAYLQARSIDLAPHPDVSSVSDLAALKQRFLRNDSDAFQSSAPLPTTVAGWPALVFDNVATRRFSTDGTGRGVVSSSDLDRFVTRRSPDSAVTELVWSARDVLTIRGGRGYAFRLFSNGPGVKNDHLGDLDQLLAGLTVSP